LPASNDNIIDRITNAHGLIERYDVSEHNVSGTALNVLGAHDDLLALPDDRLARAASTRY
jgi:hypothetical protein